MGILPGLLALVLLAPGGPGALAEEGPTDFEGAGHRVFFFVGGSPAHGLHFHVDEEVRVPEATPPRYRFVMRAQVAVGLSRGGGAAGDGSLDTPWTLLLPGRTFGLMVQLGTAPDYWAALRGSGPPESVED